MGATSPSESAAASEVRAFPLPQQTIRSVAAPSLRLGASHGARPLISSVPRHHHEARDHPTTAWFVPGGVVRSSRSPCPIHAPEHRRFVPCAADPRLSPMLIDCRWSTQSHQSQLMNSPNHRESSTELLYATLFDQRSVDTCNRMGRSSAQTSCGLGSSARVRRNRSHRGHRRHCPELTGHTAPTGAPQLFTVQASSVRTSPSEAFSLDHSHGTGFT